MKLVIRSRFVLLCLLGQIASSAGAQPPRLARVEPRSVQRGAVAEVVIRGERLETATGLLFYGEGIEVSSLEPTDDDTLRVSLRTGDDCRLGEHRFWVVGPGGLSPMATLRVGAFRLTDEEEPNNTADEPQVIEPGAGLSVRGVIDEADVDCFALQLERGERLSIDVEAMRLGGAFFDAYVDLIDPSSEVVASSDDDPVSLQDPRLSYISQTSGRHTVRIREAAFGGDFESRYVMHLGDFPVVQTAVPAGDAPGKELATRLLGDAAGPIEATIRLPGSANDWPGYRPASAEGVASPTAVPLRISGMRNVNEGGSAEISPAGAPPVALNGLLAADGEVDRFAFDATEGDTLEVEVFAARIGSPIDSVMAIDGPSGPLVRNDDDGAVHDSRTRFRVAETGRHVLSIRDHLGRGGATHAYRVEIGRVEPSLTLTTPILDPLRPQESQRILVPRGGRTAVIVAARRDRFDGPVEIEFGDLPAGVRATVDPIPVGEHLTVALLEAPVDAPLGAGLSRIQGYGDSASGTVIGQLEHEIGLVFGEPRRTVYYGSRIDRTPVAVTERAPFSISVVRPTSPLSRDGLKELVVQVERRDGFDGAVTLTTPRLPEWVERSEDPVRIESGESRTTFPLIATDRALPGEHLVVIVGAARVDGVEVSVASERTPVQLVSPHAELQIAHTTVEQGAEATVRCQLDWVTDNPAGATATLHGLPKHAEAPTVAVGADQTEIAFPVRVGVETPAALHNTLFVELAVGDPSEPVRQYHGRGGVLEVVAPGGAAKRQISRLEQLRREAARTRTQGSPRG